MYDLDEHIPDCAATRIFAVYCSHTLPKGFSATFLPTRLHDGLSTNMLHRQTSERSYPPHPLVHKPVRYVCGGRPSIFLNYPRCQMAVTTVSNDSERPRFLAERHCRFRLDGNTLRNSCIGCPPEGTKSE